MRVKIKSHNILEIDGLFLQGDAEPTMLRAAIQESISAIDAALSSGVPRLWLLRLTPLGKEAIEPKAIEAAKAMVFTWFDLRDDLTEPRAIQLPWIVIGPSEAEMVEQLHSHAISAKDRWLKVIQLVKDFGFGVEIWDASIKGEMSGLCLVVYRE